MEISIAISVWFLLLSSQITGRLILRHQRSPSSTCPQRSERREGGVEVEGVAGGGRRRSCQKKCRVDEDCKGSRRECRCDGTCGMTCVRTGMRCEPLEEVENGSYELDPDDGFGSTARYDCNDGYILHGSKERTCQGDKKWSGNAPTCVTEGVCGSPPEVANAVFNVSSTSRAHPDGRRFNSAGKEDQKLLEVRTSHPLGTQFIYTCTRGFQLSDGYQRAMCVGEGRWAGPYITCSRVKCSFPGNIPNAPRIMGSQFYYQDVVNYTCLPGYTLEGNQQRTCLENKEWSGVLPRCRQISCSSPNSIENGHVEGADFSFGSLLKYSCKVGHVLIGDETRRCLKDGAWSGLEPFCKVIHCEQLKQTVNVYFSTTETVFNTTVFFRCVGNSKSFDDSMSTTCDEHGRWTKPITRCYSKCKIPIPSKGELNRQDVEGTFVDHGYKLNFTCEPGTVLELLPECINGTWEPSVECQPSKKSCSSVRPPELKDGFFRIYRTRHGDMARYYCDAGYTLEGDDTITCTDGSWIGTADHPECKQKTCDYPGELQDGHILLVGVKGKFHYRPYARKIGQNEMIEFRCMKDYELVGYEGATCVDGKWSPEEKPVCMLRRHLPVVARFKFHRGK